MAEQTPPSRPTHVHGLPDPSVLGFISLGSLGQGVVDFDEAVRAVATRLGRPATFVDEQGYHDEIVAAAIDAAGERFAWLHCRSKDINGHVDINFRLFARRGDDVLIDWEPKTYNPYFGVNPIVLEWEDDGALEFEYREKHHTYRALFAGGQLELHRLVGRGVERRFVSEDEAQRETERRAAEHRLALQQRESRRERWTVLLLLLLGVAYLVAFIVFDQISGRR